MRFSLYSTGPVSTCQLYRKQPGRGVPRNAEATDDYQAENDRYTLRPILCTLAGKHAGQRLISKKDT